MDKEKLYYELSRLAFHEFKDKPSMIAFPALILLLGGIDPLAEFDNQDLKKIFEQENVDVPSLVFLTKIKNLLRKHNLIEREQSHMPYVVNRDLVRKIIWEEVGYNADEARPYKIKKNP